MKFFKENLVFILILISVGFFIYAFNLNNGLFWDDDNWIINNPFVHDFSTENINNWFTKNTLSGIGLRSNYYRPFLFLTFTLNYVLGGIKPLGYHLINNALHILNALIVFSLIFFLSKKRLIAFFVSLLFLVHPLQTEAVSYISGRGDPLHVFFMLLALLLFVQSEIKSISWKSWQRPLSLVFLVLALLSRETAIIFPFLLMVTYISFLSNDKFLRSLKKSVIKSVPYLALVFIYGILRLTILNFDNTLDFYAVSNIYSENLHVRMFTFLHVLWVYFRLLFVPVGLHMDRSVPIHLSFFDWPVWLTAIGLGTLLTLLVILYKRERKVIHDSKFRIHNSSFRVWFFGLGWFFVALGPTSGITPINAQIYEHWLYLAMIGFWFIFAFYLDKVLYFLKAKKNKASFLLVGGFVIYLAFLSFQGIQRNNLWGKPLEFFLDILKYEPDSVRILNNVGNIYFDKGKENLAEEYYWKAVESEDAFPQPHYNLGSILQERKDYYGAIVEYNKAIELDPYFYYAYQNLAVIYANQGDLVKAADNLEKLKQLRPHDSLVYYNLALVYLAQNKRERALATIHKGISITENPQAEKKLTDLLTEIGK